MKRMLGNGVINVIIGGVVAILATANAKVVGGIDATFVTPIPPVTSNQPLEMV